MTENRCTFCCRWEEEPELRVFEFEQTRLSLNRDQFFNGYSFLYAKEHVSELFHLDEKSRGTMIEEMSRVAKALHFTFKADKINYELLGNMVPHLHWHIIPRFKNDPLWPRPVWSESHQELILPSEEYKQRIEAIRGSLL